MVTQIRFFSPSPQQSLEVFLKIYNMKDNLEKQCTSCVVITEQLRHEQLSRRKMGSGMPYSNQHC